MAIRVSFKSSSLASKRRGIFEKKNIYIQSKIEVRNNITLKILNRFERKIFLHGLIDCGTILDGKFPIFLIKL